MDLDSDIQWIWISVSKGSKQGLQVPVRVGTDPFPNWRSGSSKHLNHQFGYGLKHISQPV